MDTEKNKELINFRIATVLTSGRFEKFYNEFVVEKQLNENDEQFLSEVRKQFDCVFEEPNEDGEMILWREDINRYFSEDGSWVVSIHQARIFKPEEKELLINLQQCFGKMFGEDDVIVRNRW